MIGQLVASTYGCRSPQHVISGWWRWVWIDRFRNLKRPELRFHALLSEDAPEVDLALV
jgi:hypothetical protein